MRDVVVSGHTRVEWALTPHVQAPAFGLGACGFCGGKTRDPKVCIPGSIATAWKRNPDMDRLTDLSSFFGEATDEGV